MPNPSLNLRRRLARWLFREEGALLREGIAAFAEARNYVLLQPPPGAPKGLQPARLGEIDSQYADMVLDLAGWVQVGGAPNWQQLAILYSEWNRQRSVIDSRVMYHQDVLTSRAADMWTDFGFGQHITVTPSDPALTDWWAEFWEAPRNRPVLGDAEIQENSKSVLLDGEFFWAVWASKLDGRCTVRRINTEQVREVITDPSDRDVPLWYIVADPGGDLYYPDWRATEETLANHPVPNGALRADQQRPLTHVVIISVQRNKIYTPGVGPRGWPAFRQALVWARAYRDFIGDRATVAKLAAMYVQKLTAKNTGQRGVDDIVSRLQSTLVNSGFGYDRNANTVAGQTWVQNEQVNLEWMSRDTGAQGAQTDGLTLLGQTATGFGTPGHWMGRPDAMQNRAVAKESGLPFYEEIQRYQTFFGQAFADLCEVVGRMFNEYGHGAVTDFKAKVGFDSPFNNDVEEIVSIMGTVAGAGLDPAVAQQVAVALMDLALKSLGIRDTDAILNPPAVAPVGAANGLPGQAGGRGPSDAAAALAGQTGASAAVAAALAGQPAALSPAQAALAGEAQPTDLLRAALALEAATAALDEGSHGGAVNIIAGAEGVAMLQPPVVNNHIDLSALTEAIKGLPSAPDLRPLLEAMAARPNVTENHIDTAALAEALEGQAVDVAALVAQIVAAVTAIPAPVVHVENVIDGKTAEKARFTVEYDARGRIVGLNKSGETESA